MAQLSGGITGAIRMDQLDMRELIGADILTQSPTEYSFNLGNGIAYSFAGGGFTFNSDGTASAGTINEFTEKQNGALLIDVTGLATSAAQFSAFVEAQDNESALRFVFIAGDNMQGTSFADYLDGYSSHDNLFGGDGADTLKGGTGNDHLYGQSPGGGADGADMVFGDDGSDYLQGNAGNDSLDGGNGSDRIFGGQDADSIFGGGGNDTINGNLGNDTIDGEDANDLLRGGQGNDLITGGFGSDTLMGDLGVDTMSGGTGIDFFLFTGTSAAFAGAAPDRIGDFENGVDRIGVGYSVSAVLTGSAQTSFSAAAALAQQLFDANAATQEVAAISVGSDAYLFFSINGGAAADSAVLLSGVGASAIESSDFI